MVLKKAFKGRLGKLMNLWPPFLGAGIRVTRIASDWKAVDVEMKLRRWNKNYVGTHYGGSLYSMADPFFMVMLIEILGREYVVWDKAATIRFRKPGTGTVRAEFRLNDEQVQEIREALKDARKVDRVFKVEITNQDGGVVAEVEKVIHISKKEEKRDVSSRAA